MLRLQRNENLISRLTLEDATKKMEDYNNEVTAEGVVAWLSKLTRPRFEIVHYRPDLVAFQLSKHRLSELHPFPELKVGGVVVTGEMQNHENRGISIYASSHVVIKDLIASNFSYILFMGLMVILLPVAIYTVLEVRINIALLVMLGLLACGLTFWYYRLTRIVNELFFTLKHTLHSSPTWTQR